MLFAVENSFATFVDKMRADRVHLSVKRPIEVFLLWEENDCSEVRELTRSNVTILEDGLLDVVPHIWRVVPVEVNDCLGEILSTLEVEAEIWMRSFHTLLLGKFLHHPFLRNVF